ncbi:MAG: ABC transporter ATP-binding protein/permease [Desulfobulbaceae bacterium]|nr:ABC transporter ATP-binding protein/permease [Desulfobulbaceae bacterium]
MPSLLHKIFDLLTTAERREMYRLVGAMAVLAVVEVAGISSIMPFMTVLAAPDNIDTNPFLAGIYNWLEFSSHNSFLLFLGVAVLCLLVINNSFTAFITWRIFYFSWMRNHSLSRRLLCNYLHQPYVFFLNRNTSELEKNIMDEVRVVVVGIFNPVLMIFKNGVIALFVFTMLMVVDPVLALGVSLTLGLAYGFLFRLISKKLNKIGKIRAEANNQRFKVANEALSGIKILKVLSREKVFLDEFSVHSSHLSLAQALKSTISQLPKYAFEVIAFGGILLIVLYFLAMGKDLGAIIPVLSLYAFAGYRLMPALQTIFTGASEIRYTIPALNILWEDIHRTAPVEQIAQTSGSIGTAMPIKQEIRLSGLGYAYPAQKENVFKDLNISIAANSTIGIVGSTGSGKTTLIDILLGLLVPGDGNLYVDDEVVTGTNIDRWRRSIGYVPQEIFLTDDSIRRNIAFGVRDENIDNDALQQACKLASIDDFIRNELPDGYDTITGERGVRLSGGQRQRIGIARALYHDPSVLILDEATSALDGITEDVIIQAINGLANKKTIIMIAHRLSTLKECDVIYVLDRGVVSAKGTYTELMNLSEYFREIEMLSRKS